MKYNESIGVVNLKSELIKHYFHIDRFANTALQSIQLERGIQFDCADYSLQCLIDVPDFDTEGMDGTYQEQFY